MEYPVIDMRATGERIRIMMKERNVSVIRVQEYMGFNHRASIYRWLHGEALPTLENIYALSILLEVPINELLVREESSLSA